MSLLKSIQKTLSANVINQFIGIITFLYLPYILTVSDYAITVYVSLILYYAGFTHIGLTHVHSRKAPQMLVGGLNDELRDMEDSIQYFWQITTLVYALIASIIFYIKYNDIIMTGLLFLIINLTPCLAFYIQKQTVRSSFTEYQHINITQSIFRLLVIAGAVTGQIYGWFIGTFTSVLGVILYIKDKSVWHINIKTSPFCCIPMLKEGIVLVGISIVWGTLLNSGRLYAALFFTDEIVAVYGIMNAAYQMGVGFLVSMCLPVTVKIYELCTQEESQLAWFLFKIQIILVVATIIGAVVIFDIVQYALLSGLIFAKYNFDYTALQYIIMSFGMIPYLCIVSSVLIGKKLYNRYLGILVLNLTLSFFYVKNTYNLYGVVAPALAQFNFLAVTVFLLLLCYWYYNTRRTIASLIGVFIPVVIELIVYLIMMVLKSRFAIFESSIINLLVVYILIGCAIGFCFWYFKRNVKVQTYLKNNIRIKYNELLFK